MSVQQRNIIKLSGIIQTNSECRKFVTNSGFEEIVYQARMCSVGGIKPVLLGKSYNMCWRIHEVVAEAISRFFQEQYVAPFI